MCSSACCLATSTCMNNKSLPAPRPRCTDCCASLCLFPRLSEVTRAYQPTNQPILISLEVLIFVASRKRRRFKGRGAALDSHRPSFTTAGDPCQVWLSFSFAPLRIGLKQLSAFATASFCLNSMGTACVLPFCHSWPLRHGQRLLAIIASHLFKHMSECECQLGTLRPCIRTRSGLDNGNL